MLSLKTLSCLKTVLRKIFSVLVLVVVLQLLATVFGLYVMVTVLVWGHMLPDFS